MPASTETSIAGLFTALIIGLFIGMNVGVLLMCLLRMASPDPEPQLGHNPPPVQPRPRPDKPTPAQPAKRPEVPTGKWRR